MAVDVSRMRHVEEEGLAGPSCLFSPVNRTLLSKKTSCVNKNQWPRRTCALMHRSSSGESASCQLTNLRTY